MEKIKMDVSNNLDILNKEYHNALKDNDFIWNIYSFLKEKRRLGVIKNFFFYMVI